MSVDGDRLRTVLPTVRETMDQVLARSRGRPLPSAPEPVDEPAHLTAFLAGCPVPSPPAAPQARSIADADPADAGVAELLAAFAAGTATPSGLLAALRVRWHDRPEGSGVLLEIGGADAAAAESDRAWANGTARPLEGIPFAVKDIIDVAGTPVTCGSAVVGDRVAERDAAVVARLRAAGAVPALMVATTEFACGDVHNTRYGVVRNPWNREHWTGGSSAGSGAAVAARLVPFALGTDTGGSVRIPSALCGLTGIKPTYGLVPRTGVASLAWSLDHVGPLARSATDLRLVLAELTGPDGIDPAAGPAGTAAAVRAALRNRPAGPTSALRVGVPTSAFFDDPCHPGVLAARDAAVEALAAGGAEVRPVDLGDVQRLDDDFVIMLCTELASNQESGIASLERYEERVQGNIARGTVPTALDYLRVLRRRPALVRAAAVAFADVDVVLAPGVGAPAPRVDATGVEVGGQQRPVPPFLHRNTAPVNVLGFPDVMVPAGLVDGLPVGVQVIGGPWADASCLAVAELLQSVTDHHLAQPSG